MRTFRGRIATLGSAALFTAVVAPPTGGIAAREDWELVWVITEGEAMSPGALIPRGSIDTPTVGPVIRIQSPSRSPISGWSRST